MIALQKGDTIGIFSPSYPVTAIAQEATAGAVSYLQAQGYQVKFGSLGGKREFYRSGSINQRADEFNSLIKDPEVRCMMASAGGMVSNAFLPYIDYRAVKKNPKVIIGHSDVSALLLGIYQKTGVTTFYGPNLVSTFGQKPPFLDYSLASMEALLFPDSIFPVSRCMPPFYSDESEDFEQGIPDREPKPNRWKTLISGKAIGRLTGGNLNTISGMMASPYMPEFRKGDILLLEDTEKFAAHAERYFSMLKIAGVFNKVGGILLGKHRKFDDQGSGWTPADILLQVLKGRSIPVLADIDCSHAIPMMTLPIGGLVEMDADNQTISVLGLSAKTA